MYLRENDKTKALHNKLRELKAKLLTTTTIKGINALNTKIDSVKSKLLYYLNN